GTAVNNVPLAFQTRGPLNTSALERSIALLVRRHEVLRTTFAESADGPIQVIHAEPERVLRRVDLAEVPAADRERDMQVRLDRDGRAPFDLATGRLFEGVIYEYAPEHHALLLRTHHSVVDGWSAAVMADELVRSYETFAAGGEASLSPLPLQYPDFAVWQRAWMKSPVCQEQVAYWRNQLERPPPTLVLREARPRPRERRHAGGLHWFVIPQSTAEAVERTAAANETGLLSIFAGLYAALLFHHSGQTEIVLGSLVANRSVLELRNLVGPFVNLVPLRLDLRDDPTCARFFTRVSQVVSNALVHPDVPFDWLVEQLAPPIAPGVTPYLQAPIVFQTQPPPDVSFPDLAVKPCSVDVETSKYDLSLTFVGGEHGLYGSLRYNTDIFDRDTVATYAEELKWLPSEAGPRPDRPLSELLKALPGPSVKA